MNKTEMLFFYSIDPKISTSVAPPSRKSTDHGLTHVKNLSFLYICSMYVIIALIIDSYFQIAHFQLCI